MTFRTIVLRARRKFQGVNKPVAAMAFLIALSIHYYVKSIKHGEAQEAKEQVPDCAVYLKGQGGSDGTEKTQR